MCLALLAIGQHPQYPVIILSNRDEFYNRATAPAHFWPENQDIYSGKDLAAGGTWLGVNKTGHFSLLTNYRNPELHKATNLSRGLLVKNFLEDQHLSPEQYIQQIAKYSNNYNPFNLIVGTMRDIFCYSNVSNKTIPLTKGIHGISNHLLDTPWYKVIKAKNLLNNILNELVKLEDPITIRDMLATILEDKTPTPDNLLPQTGVPLELEQSLGSIFIDIPDYQYGTRSSTIILMKENNIFFSEKTFMNAKALFQQQQYVE